MPLHAHIKGFVAKHGGVRPAARVLDIDHAYLYRLFTGDKENPSTKLLRKLGLRRVVLYVPSARKSSEETP